MPTVLDARREAARGFFQVLERHLAADEVLADKQCVRMIVERARTEHAAASRKRFDPEDVFRHRLLYPRMDDVIADWCRRHDVRADAFKVFRYGGTERGPTQHETGLTPSLPYIRRAFERLQTSVPELPDCAAAVEKPGTSTIAPAFRLQHPLPFGAAGDVRYGATNKDLGRGVYQVAMYAATRGDPSRNWRYDCGLLMLYALERPRTVLGPDLFDQWPEVHDRIWDAGRVWVMLL